MNKTFTRTIQIKFHEADPAGILYFANVFSLAHDTFEEFIVAAGIPWGEWFSPKKHFVPIRHCECDYFKPFVPGQKYEIQTMVGKISESSFQMQYLFCSLENKNQRHALVKMVHTFVDPKSKKKTTVPENIRKVLSPFLA